MAEGILAGGLFVSRKKTQRSHGKLGLKNLSIRVLDRVLIFVFFTLTHRVFFDLKLIRAEVDEQAVLNPARF